jgi:hypothetical protein
LTFTYTTSQMTTAVRAAVTPNKSAYPRIVTAFRAFAKLRSIAPVLRLR